MNTLISAFDDQFQTIHRRSLDLLAQIPDERVYWRPRPLPQTMTMFSCGEYLLRSAATIEQTCGGITTRLWDDPFEWTLPEALSTREKLTEYLNEVEATRQKAFGFFRTDADLARQIPAPENLRPIMAVLLDTIGRAGHFQGRAFSIFQMFSDEKLPRI